MATCALATLGNICWRRPAVGGAGWVLALALLLISSVGCQFSPRVASGAVRCGPGGTCPQDYRCHNALCCAIGSEVRGCFGGDRVDGGPDSSAPVRSDPEDAGTAGAMADAGEDSAPEPTPPRVLEAKQIVPFAAQLFVVNTCSGAGGGQAASSDRWCAFTRGRELWVINVTRALAETVACTGNNPACLRLTDVLALSDTDDDVTPGFSGDVLTFSTDVRGSVDVAFRGTVWAWLPDWPGPRRLTSESGYHCSTASGALATVCLEGVPGGYEIRAGMADEGPLAPRAMVPPDTIFSLAPDGAFFAYSHGQGAGRTLQALPLRAPPVGVSPQPLLAPIPAVRSWLFSTRRPELLVKHGYGPGPLPDSTLLAIDLERGTRQVVAEKVEAYRFLRRVGEPDRGLAMLQEFNGGRGILKLRRFGAPDNEIVVGPAGRRYEISSGLEYTAFQPVVDTARDLGDARIFDNATGVTCTLQNIPQTAFIGREAFSANGQLVTWYERPSREDEGWIARSAGCAEKRRFTSQHLYHYLIGDRGLVYVAGSPEGKKQVHWVKWGPGMAWPVAGPLASPIDLTNFEIIDPERKVFIFDSSRPESAGIYAATLPD